MPTTAARPKSIFPPPSTSTVAVAVAPLFDSPLFLWPNGHVLALGGLHVGKHWIRPQCQWSGGNVCYMACSTGHDQARCNSSRHMVPELADDMLDCGCGAVSD